MKKTDLKKESKKVSKVEKKVETKKASAKVVNSKEKISIVDLIDTNEFLKDIPSAKNQNKDKSKKKYNRPSSSIFMTYDEVLEILEEIKKEVVDVKEETKKSTKLKKKEKKVSIKAPVAPKKPLVAASIMDILGFNPQEQEIVGLLAEKDVPAKWKKYYKLLVDLLKKYKKVVDEKSSEVLNKSVKEDSGDLSSYGQHQADVGSENFERDLAFTMLSEDKLLVQEIEAAISRIEDGTYGICEYTQKAIPEDRLLSIPYTRYSIEGQEQKEDEIRKLKLGARQSIGEIDDVLPNDEEED